MNTQPGLQLQFSFMAPLGIQSALQSTKQVPDPLPDWDARSSEPHPEVIGLHLIAVYQKGKK